MTEPKCRILWIRIDAKVMTKIWRKSELCFTLLWIAGYVIGNSLSARLSSTLGIESCAAAFFNLGVSLFLFFWISRNGLMKRYGLCKAKFPAVRFLWYIPLMILISKNFWNGATVTLPITDTIFGIFNMIGVGYLEELLFRGFLFRAVSRKSVKSGIVISSVSFGLGHIVNLFNGRGMSLTENIWQIIFAIAFGFLCVIIFHQGKTLWPCILTHTIFNVTSVFSKEAEVTGPVQILQNTAVLLLMIGYAWILTRTLPEGDG